MRRVVPALALAAVIAIAGAAAYFALRAPTVDTGAPARDGAAARRPARLPDRVRVTPPEVTDPPPPPLHRPEWNGDERLEGWIVDVDGRTPGVGVTIEIIALADRDKERPPVWRSTVTDSDGRYAFERVASREYVLRIVAPHRVPTTFTRRPGHMRGRGHRPMVMGRDPRTHFVVTNEHDEPIPGATLYVLNLRGEPVETLTASSGGRIWWSPREQVRLVFAAQGHSSERVTLWRSKKDTMVRMQRGHIIAGTVRGPGGQPLPGVAVEMGTIDIPRLKPLRDAPVELDTGDFPKMDVLTDALGRFRFEGLSESPTRRLIATKKGHGKAVALAATGRDDIEIVLQPLVAPGRVSGVVLRPDGEPAAGAIVGLHTPTDASGRFDIETAYAGQPRIGATFGEIDVPEIPGRWFRERGSAPVDAPAGGVATGVVIQLEEQAISFLSVRVTGPDESPIAGTIVTTADGYPAITDQAGIAHLKFNAIPNSTSQVTVGSGDPVDVVTRAELDGVVHRVDWQQTPRLQITLLGIERGAKTKVRVTAQRIGWGIDAVEVSEFVHESAPDPDEPLIVDVYADDQFVACRLLPPIGLSGRSEHINVMAGASVHVKAERQDETPLLRVKAHLVVPATDRCWRRLVAPLSYDGPMEWRAPSVPTGRMELLVTWNGLALVEEAAMHAGGLNELSVRIPRAVEVTGTVRDGNGKPLGGCHVGARLDGGAIGPTPLGFLATTADDGAWSARVAELPDCRLAFTREGHATALLPMDSSIATRARRVTLHKEGTLRSIAPARGAYVTYARLPKSGFAWQLDDFDVEQEYVDGTGLVMRVHHLPIGDIEIALTDNSFAVTHHPVRIDPGRETVLDLSREE